MVRLLTLCALLTASTQLVHTAEKEEKLPPCAACSNLVNSFLKGVDKTKRGKLEGGDTAWEEKANLKYATSEVRFVEITEDLCDDLERGVGQCHHNHGEWEDHLEQWWTMDPATRPELKSYLCIDELRVCCPPDHYGPDCTACNVIGNNGQQCSGRGKCKGAGTRKGNGLCACSTGYSGATCDSCAPRYYEKVAAPGAPVLECAPCNKGCGDPCSGPGPKACAKCAQGYAMHTEKGCQDVDECSAGLASCRTTEFCTNTPGSYRCSSCDKSCDGCTGTGAGNCVACKQGYHLKSGLCIPLNVKGDTGLEIDNTRFFSYFALLLVTLIIARSQGNKWVVAAVGAVSAVYVGVTEYILATGTLDGSLQATVA